MSNAIRNNQVVDINIEDSEPVVHVAMDSDSAKVDLSGTIDESFSSSGGFSFEKATGGYFVPAKVTVAREWLSKRRASVRPWKQFFKMDKFKPPSGPAVAMKRVVANVEYYQSNYICLFVVLLIYCILTSPILLIALGTCFGLLYYVRMRAEANRTMRIAGREFGPAYQYMGVALLSFPLFLIAGGGAAVFWVIGASVFFILVHAVLYTSEAQPGEEFLVMEPA